MIKVHPFKKIKKMGIGDWDWGLGIGDWAQSPIPNPQSPIPNPQSPINDYHILLKENFNLNLFLYFILQLFTIKKWKIPKKK